MRNPDNLPIVGKENSYQKLKQETIREGEKARKQGEFISSCSYSKGSTFRKWWKKGWKDIDLLIHLGKEV